jgi:hypothetical protein
MVLSVSFTVRLPSPSVISAVPHGKVNQGGNDGMNRRAKCNQALTT